MNNNTQQQQQQQQQQQYNNENNEASYGEARVNEQPQYIYQMNNPYNPAPSIPVKLFVSSIPKNLTEDDIKLIFEEYGATKDVVFIKDKKPNANRANVFVRMESIYFAQKAIEDLHGKKIICETLGPLIVKFAIGELEKYGINMNNANENEAKLFVGSLPKDITDDQIRNIFNRYGNVKEVYIMKNSNGVSKRCAFVNYDYKEQGIFAVQNLNGKIAIENAEKPIEVRFAQSKNQLQERQLLNRALMNPLQMNNNNIDNNNNNGNAINNNSNGNSNKGNNNAYMKSQHFKNMNINSFNRYPMHMNYNLQNNSNQQRNNNNSIRSPWKQYFSKEDGRPYYHNELTGQTQWHKPRKMDQDFINPLNMNEVSGPVGANIFIFHIPNEWIQNDLLAAFSPFGNIISAYIATEKDTGRNRGFAFVSYDNVDSAINAVKYMNGFLAHKKKLKVTIKKGEEQYVQALINQRNQLNNTDNRRNFITTPQNT
ncbi:CUGBP Elav-like family member 2, putative [Plasmodium chabaudi chabaudi]|uniref:CUGBP Elav-like family member 2, putative n=2 Tax=Plasmodium chabaudi TaxID=5825 RepID=A0A077YER4_PLACU|nr:CUGBP Elav-like family member 2, putative [Plasmodium chabaudi chabaudi]SCM02935.1 CUGBP Elav-like family member 2, putative [Plasmodium chabaudi chabaudi]SCM05566.1 CUGBP Elav-like family member 2, putative [Plasmodium chabaudi chabaudi]SCM11223.1 CUGBP Elav-like family member 2, putative [Plasmodium chabaudi adami]VTZ66671.1 CUGBP Elav-like family member 2, putative [Plasmodium chabaudi chabaudi]|eukprot:XP_016655651.1 RNA binding protein Bruno, putative [Plasmodium chabaudi chabaudi]